MIQRCHNPKHCGYKNYGARGIYVDQQWRDSFDKFVYDVGEKPFPDDSLDRIRNDEGYIPGNVKFSTRVEQCNNKRNNISITYNGVKKNVSQWAREFGISPRAFSNRYNSGWDWEKIKNNPVRISGIEYLYEGKSLTTSEWAKELKIDASTMSRRLRNKNLRPDQVFLKNIKL